MNRYEIVAACDLPEDCGEGPNEDNYNTYLVDTSCVPWRIIAYDGGEPEDKNFCRDFSMLADELNEAYKKGHNDGFDYGLMK